MHKKGIAIHIEGRVQGVGFRYSTKHKANDLNLTGFVKNMPDGKVYIEAFGEKSNIDLLILWCYQGNSFSKVFNVKFSEIPFVSFSNFSIER